MKMEQDRKLPILKLLHYGRPIDSGVEATGAFAVGGQVDVILALKDTHFWKCDIPYKIKRALIDFGYSVEDVEKARKLSKISYLMPRDKGLKLIEQEVRRQLSKGVGYNDIPGHGYKIETRTHNKPYNKWQQMMRRCFTLAWHDWKPTYKGCTIDPEWLIFSNFKRWYDAQKLAGKYCELDKDILVQGNKHYSPETCVLVTAKINALLKSHNQGTYLRGVNSIKNGEKFSSSLSIENKTIYLGTFDTEIAAHNAYVDAKEANIKKVASQAYEDGEICSRTYKGFMNYRYNFSSEATF